MQSKMKQQGLTLISIMMLIVIFTFVAISLVKVIPVYFDSYKVTDVVSGLKDTHGLGEKSKNEIARIILDRLAINIVTDVTRNDIYVERVNNSIFVDVEYEVRKPMFGNIDVVMKFKKSVEASAI